MGRKRDRRESSPGGLALATQSRKPSLIVASAVVLGIGGWLIARQPAARPPEPTRPSRPASEAQIRTLCASCHHFPEPDILPKAKWPGVIDRMYGLVGQADGLPPSVEIKGWFV